MGAAVRIGRCQLQASHGRSDGSNKKSAEPGRSGTAGANGRARSQLDRETYWLDLWAFATSPLGLGLSSAVFWSLTPREFAAHRKIFTDKQRQHAYALAEIQATLHNAWFKRKDEPERGFTVEEFLPEDLRPPKRRQTWQEQLAVMQRFTAQMAEAAENKTG